MPLYFQISLESLGKFFIKSLSFQKLFTVCQFKAIEKAVCTDPKNGQEIKNSPGPGAMASGMYIINIIMPFLQIKKQS